jgi:hypothetical protein
MGVHRHRKSAYKAPCKVPRKARKVLQIKYQTQPIAWFLPGKKNEKNIYFQGGAGFRDYRNIPEDHADEEEDERESDTFSIVPIKQKRQKLHSKKNCKSSTV